MLAVSGNRRQKQRARARNRVADAALGYAELGWPCVVGAHPPSDGDRACSCDRVGCPDPGAHPVSAAWAVQATTDRDTLTRWWTERPHANVILPTGRVFDVFDVPALAALPALTRIAEDSRLLGPVAVVGDERYLFFVATRNPDDEDEWWSCHLDCSPETLADNPGMRWHCRNSYVLAAPSVLPSGRSADWIRPPDGAPLPDPLRVLEVLAD